MATHRTPGDLDVSSGDSELSSASTQDRDEKAMGIIAYFANNSVAANLIMGLLLIGGLISGFGLNAQVFLP